MVYLAGEMLRGTSDCMVPGGPVIGTTLRQPRAVPTAALVVVKCSVLRITFFG